MRVASCSVKGVPDAAENHRRRELLHEVARLLKQFPPVDAAVLPGGYFVQQDKSNHYLDLSFKERRTLLMDAPFARDAEKVAKKLDRRRKGALLIFGVDTDGPKSAMGDQLCVAWSTDGPVGVGRKVFPTKQEGKCGYIVNVDDFGTNRRLVKIGDARILLCACYDGYGIYNKPDKSRYISQISIGGRRVPKRHPDFPELLRHGLSKWDKLVGQADAATVAIHYFGTKAKPRHSTNYWRRHGIATASATLNGGWVIAGAHFHGRLPESASTNILAATAVPSGHLKQGNNRKTCDATPLSEHLAGKDEVLVRLFDFGGNQPD